MSFLKDGFATTVTLANLPAVKLKEVGVTPPALKAGGPIDQTTMRNVRMRTHSPKSLLTLSQIKGMYAYDPAAYGQLLTQIGINQLITTTFPDGSTLASWGWLDDFAPAESKEGTRPEAACIFEPSNMDNNNVEQLPVYTPGP